MATVLILLLAAAAILALYGTAAKPQPVRVTRNPSRDELRAAYLERRDRLS